MPVEKTASPKVIPVAAQDLPVKIRPSSKTNSALLTEDQLAIEEGMSDYTRKFKAMKWSVLGSG
jgi:hypothetical protein